MSLSLLETLDVLLDNGSICMIDNNQGTKRTYKVMQPSDYIAVATICVGRITEKTFKILLTTSYIEPLDGVKTDKYGNIYHFFETNIQRLQSEEGKNHGKNKQNRPAIGRDH